MGKNYQNQLVTVTERNILASREAENNCLGIMLRNRETIPQVSGLITSGDMNWQENKYIFDATVDLFSKNQHVDHITVSDELSKRGLLDAVGGIIHLETLSEVSIGDNKAEEYASRVREWSAIRSVKEACKTQIDNIQTGKITNVVDIINDLTGSLHNTGSRLTKGGFISTSDAHDEIFSKIEYAHKNPNDTFGIKTGIASLDHMLGGGIQRGDYVILAARTSVGKTALALQLLKNSALGGEVSAIFSLEMSKEQLIHRMIASEAKVNSAMLRTGGFSSQEFKRVQEAAALLSNASIFIDESSGTTIQEIRAKLTKLKHKTGRLGLVVIDYIGLIAPSGSYDNTHMAMGEISRELKALAKDLNVALLVVAQLNRNSEGRADKTPVMSDIADSDRIPRDADVVILMFRPNYYEKKENYADNSNYGKQLGSGRIAQTQPATLEGEPVKLIVEKQRNGPTGTIDLQFNKASTSFYTSSRV